MKTSLPFALALLLAGPVSAAPKDLYGKPLAGLTPTPLAELGKNPGAYAGKTVRTEGAVASVCTTKGCWMTMDAAGTPVRVTFKDYAFFVPKDLPVGSTATLEGVFKVETIDEGAAKHYARETPGGDPGAGAIKGPRKELSIVASGVELVRAEKK